MEMKKVVPILAITMALALGLAAQGDSVAHADTKSGYIACASLGRQAVTVGGTTGGSMRLVAGAQSVSYRMPEGQHVVQSLKSGRSDANWMVQATRTASPAMGDCRIL